MLEIALYSPRQHRQFQHSGGPLTLARKPTGPSLWTAVDRSHADAADALVEIVPRDGGISLCMARCEAEWLGDPHCTPICAGRSPLPVYFAIGDTRFEIIDSTTRPTANRRSLEKLHANDVRDAGPASGTSVQKSTIRGPSPATLSKWFAALGTLNRWSTSLQELYVQAARVAVDAIGLDGAVVLRRRDDEWEIAASHLPHPELGIHCDLAVLDQLLTTPETLFQGADERGRDSFVTGMPAADSRLPVSKQSRPQPLTDLEPAVVVSPVRNAAGQLCGAIHGYRSVRTGNDRRGIRYLEAHLIELLANAMSAGISRLEHEAESERRRVLLQQFAAGTSAQKPHRLVAQQREVTLLFADLRGFTQLSNTLDMNVVCELLGQVMDCLTAAVMDHDGLVIDYYGDGLAAMWNAPAEQAEHPELACRAALRMLDTLTNVAADWAEVLDDDLQLGIGVHTGMVQVGNAGSRHRTKYGPRGANVNLASRLEKTTKEFGVPLLATRATASRLSNRLHAHPVGRAQLPGFDEPIEVYTIGTVPLS